MSDIFTSQEETNSNNQAAIQNEAADAITKALMSITRPDGSPKYTDPLQALEALKASQDHIAKIEADNASLRDKANKVDTLEETLKRLGDNMNNGKPNPQTENEGGRSVEAAEELVSKLLEKKLQERDAVNTAVSNVKRVSEALAAKYGDKANDEVNRKAKALKTSAEQLKQLAAESPDLVLELFGSASGSASPNLGNINLGGYSPPEEKIEAPERSILSGPGATHKNQMEFFNKIKSNVNKRLGVQT